MRVENKTIKSQFTEAELENNYYNVVNKFNTIIKDKNYVLIIDGEEVEMVYLKPDFNNLSKSARKNIAKRLYYLDSKPTLRNFNHLFLVMLRTNVIDKKVKCTVSKKELEIQSKRKIWLSLRNKADQALKDYKEEKGDFYKKNQ